MDKINYQKSHGDAPGYKAKTYFQIQWKRPDHSTWQIDADENTSLFKTKKEAIEYLNSGGFDNLETRIVEVN